MRTMKTFDEWFAAEFGNVSMSTAQAAWMRIAWNAAVEECHLELKKNFELGELEEGEGS